MASRTVSVLYLGAKRWAHLRTTLPPKPGSLRTRPYQQRIALGISATTPDGRRRIKVLKARLEQEVFSGTFSWGNWSSDHRPKSALSIGELIAGLEKHLNATKKLAPRTWSNSYLSTFRLRFPRPDEELTAEKVVAALAESDRDSSVRKRDHTAISALVKFAELDVDLAQYRPGYTRKMVKLQDLPSDEEIVSLIDTLAQPHRWIIGTVAAYGLRPSEIVGLELGDDATIYVHEERKTGRRPVRPLPSEWVDRWDLTSKPPIPWTSTNPRQVADTLRAFLDRREWWFHRYAFRHCFARRCAERNISPAVAARMMGHSTQVHQSTYHQFIQEGEWVRMFDEQAKG
jgi:integrase